MGGCFEHGSRVRARAATAFVSFGTQGSVVGVWPTIPHAYEVRFEGQRQPWLMWEDELECIQVELAVAGPEVRC